MVDQNYILYVNSKKNLRTAPMSVDITTSGCHLAFTIPEKHLICGMILFGVPIKGDRLKQLAIKPIEKYLFEFSNIHFILPDLEYSLENTGYNWTIFEMDDLLYRTLDFGDAPTYEATEQHLLLLSAGMYSYYNNHIDDFYLHFSIDGGKTYTKIWVDWWIESNGLGGNGFDFTNNAANSLRDLYINPFGDFVFPTYFFFTNEKEKTRTEIFNVLP